ncbi:hypothetical protein FB645_000625 [Coemansia sp. IMI 203386]|nr:hypothetical protein FB645_000625 [Coemansia sp. IMI 203386]
MRWKKVLCMTLACAAAVVLGQSEEEQEVRGLVRAAAVAAAGSGGGNQGHASGGEHQQPQQQQQQQQAHGNSNNGKGAQSPDNNKDSKAGKGAAKAGDGHEAAQHDKPQANTKDGHHDNNAKKDATSSSGDKNKEKEKEKEKDKKPSKTRKLSEDDNDDDDDEDDEAEKEYLKRVKADKDAGKLPGRMKMVVPPRTVHTPLFELDSVVELKWEYDNNVIEVPEKLMISVQLPKDPHDPSAKPVVYDIATNVTGKKKSFFWDTKNDVPEGVGMREGSGYTMFFYDGDIGFRMSDVVPSGYLIKYAMPFAFYISRYERTNDGVPRNYNPNDGARQAPSLGLTAALLLAVSAVVHFWGA